MIQVNEVRVGNILKHIAGGGMWVVEWNNLFRLHLTPDEHEGISITPEIMGKCGFETNGNFWYRFDSDICIRKDISAFIMTDSDAIDVPYIKHLHQLQNLYFALTGEELNYQP